MRRRVTHWEVWVDGELCSHQTVWRWTQFPHLVPVDPLALHQPSPVCLFTLSAIWRPPCRHLCVGSRGCSGPAQPRPRSPEASLAAPAARHRPALQGPRVSQRAGAGICSDHALSPGAALHGRGWRPWQQRREGQPSPCRHPCTTLMAFDGQDRRGSTRSPGPLLHPHLPVLVQKRPAALSKCPCDHGVSVLFHTAFPLPGIPRAYLVYPADPRLPPCATASEKPSLDPEEASSTLRCPATLAHTSS